MIWARFELRTQRETSVAAASAGTAYVLARIHGYSCLARAITSGEHGPSELLVHSLLPTMDSSYLFMEITEQYNVFVWTCAVHCYMNLCMFNRMHGTSIGPYMLPGLHLLHIQAPKSCTPQLSPDQHPLNEFEPK